MGNSIRPGSRLVGRRAAWLLAALMAGFGTLDGYAQTKDGTPATGKAGGETTGTARLDESRPRPPDMSAAKKLSPTTTVDVGGRAWDICLAGNLAYVAADGALVVLDISKPTAPKKVGSVAIPGTNMRVEVAGDVACVANYERGLVTVDISQPAGPKPVGSVALPKCRTVAVKGQTAYILSFGGILKVVDVSNPAAPKEVLTFGLPAWRPPNYHKPVTPEQEAEFLRQLQTNSSRGGAYGSGLTVRGNVLLAVEEVYGRLYYYDVTAPAKPVFKGTHFAPYLLQCDIFGDWVFAMAGYNTLSGIVTVKLSDLSPEKATRYDQYPAGDYIGAGCSVDQLGIAVSESGKHVFWYGGKSGTFQVLDSSDPGHLKVVGTDTITKSHGVGILLTLGVKSKGDTIYVCAGANGVVIYSFPDL